MNPHEKLISSRLGLGKLHGSQSTGMLDLYCPHSWIMSRAKRGARLTQDTMLPVEGLSLWSDDSFLSLGSTGSFLSIGSVGSALSIGSIGSRRQRHAQDRAVKANSQPGSARAAPTTGAHPGHEDQPRLS
jgi:hypothetical protein